jgi:hypothetical protein
MSWRISAGLEVLTLSSITLLQSLFLLETAQPPPCTVEPPAAVVLQIDWMAFGAVHSDCA